MNKTIKCTSKFLLFILFLTIIGWTYSCLKLKALSNHINEQNNQHQKYHDILNNTNIFIDSLQHEIKHLREIFDSLPLGPPLDTLAINDGFGISNGGSSATPNRITYDINLKFKKKVLDLTGVAIDAQPPPENPFNTPSGDGSEMSATPPGGPSGGVDIDADDLDRSKRNRFSP